MYRFKFFMVFVLVAFAVGFIAFTNASIAGAPFIQNFELKPPYLSGQTCEESGDVVCAYIDYCDNDEIVSQVSVWTAKPGKIRIDFCAGFEATDCYSCDEVTLDCNAFVDNNEARPGDTTLGEAEEEGDSSGCFSWFAPVSGNYRTHFTQVRCRIECEDNCDCDVEIEQYTHSVFFNKL